jgi:predicted dehydrogenase
MPNPMRLAMSGVWHVHATGMVRQIAAHSDEFQLVGLYDRDADLARARAREWSPLLPGLRVFESEEELFAQPLNGVLVEGRVDENVATARRAVERGFPVLLEKPGGVDLASFEDLLTLAARRGVTVQLAWLFRRMAAVERMLEAARAGELGRVYAFRGRLPKPVAEYDVFVEDLGRYAGGMFFEMAGHLVDFLVTLCGPPRNVVSRMCHHADPGRPGADRSGAFVDNGVALVECEHALGVLEVTALETATDARRIEVYGSEGAFVIPHLGSGHVANDAVQPYEQFSARTGEWTRHEPLAKPLQIGDLREFRAVVRGEKAPDYSPAHDRVVHETLLRACGMNPAASQSG